MVKRQTKGEWVFQVFNILFMLFMLAVTFYPFFYCVLCSFSDADQLVGNRGLMLLPKGFSTAAYQMVFANPNIQSGYMVTVFVVVTGTVLDVVLTSIGAFLVTRKHFPLGKAMTYMMLFTMYFSGGMIPTYLVVFKLLHLGNSIWALILPGAVSVYNLIIMRTNFAAIPDSLEESAKIDGANDFTVFSRIIMPLSKSILAVMILFYGVAHWNSWFNAMLYIQDRDKYPLQLIMREILLLNATENMSQGTGAGDKYSVGESVKYATIIVSTVPILCVYPFLQKYFVKGVMVGAVKG